MLKVLALSLNNSNFVNRSNSKQNINTASNLFLGKDTVSFSGEVVPPADLELPLPGTFNLEEDVEINPLQVLEDAHRSALVKQEEGDYKAVLELCEKAEKANNILRSSLLYTDVAGANGADYEEQTRLILIDEIAAMKMEALSKLQDIQARNSCY